ncbi:MAG: hypothetical protein NT145_03955 [Elusimicrobia bacterium]|nr:hypothetical protein [Elusimicrobiota bacterium]
MIKKLLKTLQTLICFVLIVQLTGCGLLLHPERKGQRSGRIDGGIAVLDGIGLLFFILPGVIAFAVDFSTGTIYLPRGRRSSLDLKDIKQVKFDPNNCDNSTIENIIKNETGYSVKLNQKNMQVSKLKSLDDMEMQFAKVSQKIKNTIIASNRKY